MKGIFKCKNCGKQFEKFWYTKIPIYCSVKCRDIFQIGKNSPHYGKHHTEEIKQKIREKRKLQTFSEETRK